MPRLSGYVKTFNDDELISFRIDEDKLLEKYRTIWTRTEELKGIELPALPVYDDKYIKNKIRMCRNKF